MFTKKQILHETEQYQKGKLVHSEIVDDWMDMAAEWLTNDPSEYLTNGFDGFNDRSPKQILCDFYLADKVNDMTEEEFNQIMDEK